MDKVSRFSFRVCSDDDPVVVGRIIAATATYICFGNVTSTCDPFIEKITLGFRQCTCRKVSNYFPHGWTIAQRPMWGIDPDQKWTNSLATGKAKIPSQGFEQFDLDKYLHIHGGQHNAPTHRTNDARRTA